MQEGHRCGCYFTEAGGLDVLDRARPTKRLSRDAGAIGDTPLTELCICKLSVTIIVTLCYALVLNLLFTLLSCVTVIFTTIMQWLIQQHDSEIVTEHENPASSTCDHCAMLLTLLTVARFN